MPQANNSNKTYGKAEARAKQYKAYLKEISAEPMDELPKLLQYKSRRRLLPPRYHYGWVLNMAQIVRIAKESDMLSFYTSLPSEEDSEDDSYESMDEEYESVDDNEDKGTSAREDEDDQDEDIFVQDGKEIDVIDTIRQLLYNLVFPTFMWPSGHYTRLAQLDGQMVFVLGLYDNRRPSIRPLDEDIKKVCEVMGFKESPRWYLDMTEDRWARR